MKLETVKIEGPDGNPVTINKSDLTKEHKRYKELKVDGANVDARGENPGEVAKAVKPKGKASK